MWQHCLSTADADSITFAKFDWQAHVYKGSCVVLCLEGACSRGQLQRRKVLQGCYFVDGWAPDCYNPEVCVMGGGVAHILLFLAGIRVQKEWRQSMSGRCLQQEAVTGWEGVTGLLSC
jgi:hypothetical protein